MAYHQLTNTEVENKTAFFVQLNALLLQISSVVNSEALSSAQKAKLSDVCSATAAWLKDVGAITTQSALITADLPSLRPPEAATSVSDSVSSQGAAATAGVQQKEEEVDVAHASALKAAAGKIGTNATASSGEGNAAVMETPSSADTSRHALPSLASSTRLSFFAEGSALHPFADERYITGLANYMRLLFVSDLPERSKLQALGKTLVRLLTVRCCSMIMASLQHVAHHSYTITKSTGETTTEDNAAAGSAPFVRFAKQINVATRALLACVQLVTRHAVPSDATSIRFPVQLCVDVVKQTRRALMRFQTHIEKEELCRLRSFIVSTESVTKSSKGSEEDVGAAQNAYAGESPDRMATHVQERIEALRRQWGPSLVHSVLNIGNVIKPCVKLLTSVAAFRAEGAPTPLVALKKDATQDLIFFCGSLMPPVTTAARGQGGLAKLSSTSDVTPGAVQPPLAGDTTPLMWRDAASDIFSKLGSSFSADYFAAVAGCCGDSDEGQLLATRLFIGMLRHIVVHNVRLLRCVLEGSQLYRSVYDGILSCVTSTQPVVLAAGLEALGLFTTTCPLNLGSEVGFLYNNVVLRLLDSPNSPPHVKHTILLHLLTTFMSNSSTVPTDSDRGTVPLILHLYRLYDLDVHAYRLNIMQQFTSALSRIVRAAPKEELMQDASVKEQLRLKQGAASDVPGPAPPAAAAAPQSNEAQHHTAKVGGEPLFDPPSTAAAPNLASLSLPAMALYGLVRIAQLLRTQIPPEDESGKEVLARLPAITCRESKLKEQQEVDLFNEAPKRTIYRLFNVTSGENTVPASHATFSIQWDHTLLPPLPSTASVQKVEAVADFLAQISSLNPAAVAEFLTTPEMFPLHVCAAYLRRLPLAGYSVLEAINELLMRVQLPREGQRIERLLEYFSAAYYAANSVSGIDRDVFPFKSDTAVFILVVATVMLNTNIHNPSAGVRLDMKAFRSQLRCCNDHESFNDSFVDEVFLCISDRPLESIKGVTGDATASTESTSRGTFDMFFISQEEKRHLAFSVERQRMVSETQQLLKLQTPRIPLAPASDSWWCAVVKDLFLSTWSPVCAVFGPAMYEGDPTAPLDVLLQCVRGLQSLLHTATAFDLSTECTVTLLTLLRMSEVTPVQAHCRRAVLVVASTTHAVNFPVRCWVAVCQLILEMRRTSTAATPPLVEDVFTRVERITRLSLDVDDKCVTTDLVSRTDRLKEAIRRVVEGIMTTISGYAVGDVANISSALAVLRRTLEFTRIVHDSQSMDIAYFVNAREFATVVVPIYVELMTKHSSSDDGLQVLFESAVDVLCTMWVSYSTRRVKASLRAAAEKSEVVSATTDTPPFEFVQSFRCLRSIYDVTIATPSNGTATLLQMHTLQGVKEMLSRILRAVEMISTGPDTYFLMLMTVWQEALYPVAMALCDRDSTATEAGSLALLVLRKLVALCGGTGTACSDRLSVAVRSGLLWLLAQLAYMGGMCGDADSAQVCVALLSSICTAMVAIPATVASSSLGWGAADLASPAIAVANPIALAQLMRQRNLLTGDVVMSLQRPEYVARDTLTWLCLLLQCEREQTRAEVVHQLRTLSLQMRPPQLSLLALDLAAVLLENTTGHTEQHHTTAIKHTSVTPFLFYQMKVPASMRQCSRSSFRSTLPAALGFLSHELLTSLDNNDDLAKTADVVLRRCLLPILLSPHSPHQSRFLAVRSLSQCIGVCLQQKGGPLCPRLAQCVLDCLAMALYAVRVPLSAVVPPDTIFVGRHWLETPATDTVSTWGAYCARATHTVQLMGRTETQGLLRRASPDGAEAAQGGISASAVNGVQKGEVADSAGSRGGRAAKEETYRVAAAALVPDEPLIEYVNILVQILAGVPKELQNVLSSAAAGGSAETPCETKEDTWALPQASPVVLLQLCLQAAGTLFAVLWRINHSSDVEHYALQSTVSRRESPAFTRNSGLLPHAAIRSVLQCYLRFAILASEYPSDELLAVTTDIIEAIRQVQTTSDASASSSPSNGGGAGAVTAAPGVTSLAADLAALQRLSPQEQQHVRTCNSGMYQQLATVLEYLVQLVTGQSTPVAGWTNRQDAFAAMVLHPRFFASLVSLLTPSAGALIITVRGYLVWYIAHAQLPDQVHEVVDVEKAVGASIREAGAQIKSSLTSATEGTDDNMQPPNEAPVNGTHDSDRHARFGSVFKTVESETRIHPGTGSAHAQISTQCSDH